VTRLALSLLAVYGAVALIGRILLQLGRTGSTGVIKPSGVEWLNGALLFGGFALATIGPALAASDSLEPIGALDGRLGHVAGIALAVGGMTITVLSQLAMGNAWRIGVEPSEQTELVTGGPFAIVRNPIYSGMIPFFFGIALLVPSPLTIAGAASVLAALELQTRVVEEPYLLRTHGEAYSGYAARVGRFLPGLGRLRRG
jgi:protein-S-isoprenylcysteine O-methyltransferase Ste14